MKEGENWFYFNEFINSDIHSHCSSLWTFIGGSSHNLCNSDSSCTLDLGVFGKKQQEFWLDQAYRLGFQKDVRKVQESTGGEKMKLKVGKKLWDSGSSRPRSGSRVDLERITWFPSCSAYHLWVRGRGCGCNTLSQSGFRVQSQIIAPLVCIQCRPSPQRASLTRVKWMLGSRNPSVSLTFFMLEAEMISLKWHIYYCWK